MFPLSKIETSYYRHSCLSMDGKHLFICCFLIVSWHMRIVFTEFKDVTSDVGLKGARDGIVAAFGDFDSNKKTDIFFILNSKDDSNIFLWDVDDDKYRRNSKAIISLKGVFATSVIPGDFNGDGHLDVLVAYHNTSFGNDKTFVKVYLGKRDYLIEEEEISLKETLKDQPAIIDFDGDLHPDLLGEKNSDGKRYWWKYNDKNKTFDSHLISTKDNYFMSKPHSCGFLDLNNDYTPDIFIPTSKDGSSKNVKFEVWVNEKGEFNESGLYTYKPKNIDEKKELVVGQSSFADIDSDGIVDHVLPVSLSDFSQNEIHVYSKSQNKWFTILSSGSNEDFKWRFVNDNKDVPLMTLRIGDYNQDGYPDAVAVVAITVDQKKPELLRVVLLENVGCSGGGCFNGRKFSMNWNIGVLSAIKNPILVGFIDLYDNGVLDLFVVSSNGSSYQTHAIKNNIYSDTCFLKVVVLGSSCFSDCPSGVTPYGVNNAGPFVKYHTTSSDGGTQQSSATQLSQASYFALQPPYVVFGLGRTPNFLEKLIIGLPRSKDSPRRQHTWTSIIPNSQVIIIPYPPDEPSGWKWKLLLTPSRLVLLTGSALLATCVFIGAIIGLLHWKEKREDRKEKQEAAHKFHFDAM